MVLSERPFWQMVRALYRFEGATCLWRVPIAAVAWAAPVLLPIAAAVFAAWLARDGFDLRTAVVAAALAGAVSVVSARLARMQLHRRLVVDRLHSFERPNPATGVPVLVRSGDVTRAELALRRARLNPAASLLLGQPPDDALELDAQLRVEEPERWVVSADDAARTRRIADVLRAVGVRSRVAGVDVLSPSGGALEVTSVSEA